MQFRGLSTVASLTLLSRVLGLARDAGMAVLFGAGPLLDAFSLAFRLPNLARRLFGEGALTTAFLPVFLKAYDHDEDHGRRIAWSTIAVLTALLAVLAVVVCSIALLAAPLVGEEFAFLLELIALLFPYVIFICVAAQASAVLHARNRFFWPAALPVLLNTIWLFAVFFAPAVTDNQTSQMRWVAASIVAAGLIQCGTVFLNLHGIGLGYRTGDLTVDREKTRAALKDVGTTMLPTLAGLTVTQLNVVIDSILAWTLSPSSGVADTWQFVNEGTASALYLGQRLLQFPLGVFGVALGTVLFPLLTRHAQANNTDAFRDSLTRGLQLSCVIGIPASLGLVMLATRIPRLLFEYGEFDASDTLQTSKMIAAYGIGVWAAVGLLILNRGLYASGDTSTPLRIGLWAVAVNLVLDALFLWKLGGYGLALATTSATVFQLALSMHAVRESIDVPPLVRTAAKTSAAALVMVAVLAATMQLLPASTGRLAGLTIPFATGVAAFAVTAWIVKLRELLWLVTRER